VTEGLVVVDKPAGLTSHDVVVRLRRLLGTRRVGHAGTLDPMATGVLVAGVGRATRLLGHLQLADKAYDATIRLGASTSTDDAQGEVTGACDASRLNEVAVRRGVAALTGDLQQVPSAVSAIKVDGRRSYERVRAGEDVRLAPRSVQVTTFDVRELRRVGPYLDLDVEVACSTGTYVRALARDLGESLGVGGHLTRLRRTRVGPFGLDEASALADAPPVLSLTEAVRRCFPVLEVDEQQADHAAHGRALALRLPTEGPVALLTEDGTFLGLYEQRGGTARAVAVFAG
jgi:tRNA pseudouridine55 synthase